MLVPPTPKVAKNALLALADLWRGLGDTLDPELPMVCPGLVKKLADKVEFLAEAAREVSERRQRLMPTYIYIYICITNRSAHESVWDGLGSG